MPNIIRFSPESKCTLDNIIYEILRTGRVQVSVHTTIVLEKIYNSVHEILLTTSLVSDICGIIMTYINDIIELTCTVFESGKIIVIAIRSKQQHINCEQYDFLASVSFSVHYFGTKDSFMHIDRSGLEQLYNSIPIFNTYMKKYYGKENYISQKYSDRIIHVKNNRKMKNIIVIIKLFVKNFIKARYFT